MKEYKNKLSHNSSILQSKIAKRTHFEKFRSPSIYNFQFTIYNLQNEPNFPTPPI
jgi:hypothetical protein